MSIALKRIIYWVLAISLTIYSSVTNGDIDISGGNFKVEGILAQLLLKMLLSFVIVFVAYEWFLSPYNLAWKSITRKYHEARKKDDWKAAQKLKLNLIWIKALQKHYITYISDIYDPNASKLDTSQFEKLKLKDFYLPLQFNFDDPLIEKFIILARSEINLDECTRLLEINEAYLPIPSEFIKVILEFEQPNRTL